MSPQKKRVNDFSEAIKREMLLKKVWERDEFMISRLRDWSVNVARALAENRFFSLFLFRLVCGGADASHT